MKKSLFALLLFSVLIISCGESKKEEVQKETAAPVEETKQAPAAEASGDDLVAMGEKLFTDKTCVSCHQVDAKIVGPSIKDITAIYKEQNGSIVAFLKGEQEPMVDKDPGQVAIMKANIDGFVKDLSDQELKALEAYMWSHE